MKNYGIIFSAIIVFISRMFFVDAGFGHDADAWRIANSAKLFAETGLYEPSRFPGFPVPEIVLSFLPAVTPFYANTATALLSAAAFIFFCLLLKQFKKDNYLTSGLAFAFTPIIFLNSIVAMDYIWALCFIIICLYFCFKKNFIAAGFFLGLAIGSRFTSAIMILPALLIIFDIVKENKIKSTAKFIIASGAVSVLCYLPPLNYYKGLDSIYVDYPGILQIAYRSSINLWGAAGTAAIIFSFIYIIKNFSILKRTYGNNKILFIAFVPAVIFYILFFLAFPYEAGYLIPVIPLIIILLFITLPEKIFNAAAMLIILSSFLITLNKEGLSLKGPVFTAHSKRTADMEYLDKIIEASKSFNSEAVIVVGPNLPKLEFLVRRDSKGFAEFAYLLNRDEINFYLANRYKIYYLPDEREYNLQVHRIDLANYGQPLNVED